jgi:2-polyprenyl-3-methyl-5-hydroxy-6-metoxy-1,4-benzoquinol methylase
MIHDIPDSEVIDRKMFILKNCLDKVVLDIGCYGPLHTEIKQIAKTAYGIDHRELKDDPLFFKLEITKAPLPELKDVEIVVCGEVVEHLSNPGLFLEELKQKYSCQKIFSVPNAFGVFHTHWIKNSQENVNDDHVAYYSYKTFTTLLTRYGYKVKEFYWYDNPTQVQKQGFNEGLVFVTI